MERGEGLWDQGREEFKVTSLEIDPSRKSHVDPPARPIKSEYQYEQTYRAFVPAETDDGFVVRKAPSWMGLREGGAAEHFASGAGGKG